MLPLVESAWPCSSYVTDARQGRNKMCQIYTVPQKSCKFQCVRASINLRTVGRKMIKIAEIVCYIYFSPHFTDMSPQYLVMTDLLKHNIRIIIGVPNVPRHAHTIAETTPLA